MTVTQHELAEMVARIRYDLTAAQAKLTDLKNTLDTLELPPLEAVTCDECRLRFRGPKTLAMHVYQAHDGPLPAHVVEAERRSAA